MKFEEFLENSYTAFHAVANCEKILTEADFKKLTIGQDWKLKDGGKYFVTKNQSTIIAFVVGDLSNYHFNIVAAHTDSPALKVKGCELIKSPAGNRINVEIYGSPIYYSYFNIPLKIAGRLYLKENDKIISKIVTSKTDVTIPSLAIHLNRDINSHAEFKVQNDMLPFAGNAENIYSFFDEKNIVDSDLFVVSDIKPFRSGLHNQYLSSPRIDNLASVYCAINAIKECKAKGVAIAALFDNEEIGSATKQGAGSSLLQYVLMQINHTLNKNLVQFQSACENGLLLSADNAHAVHPAHQDKTDPANTVYLGQSLTIKHHKNYTTDGYSSALLKNLLSQNNMSFQDFYSNSDIACGSTLGYLPSQQLSMRSVDIGIPQLSMHSAIEMIETRDLHSLEKCFKLFYQTTFNC